MKRRLWNIQFAGISIFILFFSIANANLGSPKMFKQKSDFGNLKLELATTRKDFIQLEPVPVVLKLSNETYRGIVGHSSLDFSLAPIELSITHNGITRTIKDLSANRACVEIPTRIIEPGQNFQLKQPLAYGLDEIFPQLGVYQIQVVLYDLAGKEFTKSNVISVRIREPKGFDLEAFQYIKNGEHRSSLFAISERLGRKEARPVLQEFLSKFRGTTYADYVTLMLSDTYLFTEEYEAVIETLEELSTKSNFGFADRVLVNLIEANLKLKNFEQAKLYLDLLKTQHPESHYVNTPEVFRRLDGMVNR